MNYLKYTQYIYLIFAAFFVYDALQKYRNQESPWLSVIVAAMAIFMFFFRRNFYNKHINRNK